MPESIKFLTCKHRGWSLKPNLYKNKILLVVTSSSSASTGNIGEETVGFPIGQSSRENCFQIIFIMWLTLVVVLQPICTHVKLHRATIMRTRLLMQTLVYTAKINIKCFKLPFCKCVELSCICFRLKVRQQFDVLTLISFKQGEI